ncbi:hypothetical protein TWF718_007897 [Orbilia javanica]|uniref:Uncharacterized protein n=1 Tax=Orbilia javanica TaxID=47235 RepID=A0AAN8RML4_9PEZI
MNRLSFSTNTVRSVVFLACAVKLVATIPTWARKARKISFFDFLALTNSTLTDWMLFIVATYILLYYIGKSKGRPRRRPRHGYAPTPSTRSDASIFSGSDVTAGSDASHLASDPAAEPVIDNSHTQVTYPMEQFLRGRDEYFLTARGMIEGSFDGFGRASAAAWNSGVEYGRMETLLEQTFE